MGYCPYICVSCFNCQDNGWNCSETASIDDLSEHERNRALQVMLEDSCRFHLTEMAFRVTWNAYVEVCRASAQPENKVLEPWKSLKEYSGENYRRLYEAYDALEHPHHVPRITVADEDDITTLTPTRFMGIFSQHWRFVVDAMSTGYGFTYCSTCAPHLCRDE